MSKRKKYADDFKTYVAQEALTLPATARIKPICKRFPYLSPVQVRKWIRLYCAKSLLLMAENENRCRLGLAAIA